MKPKSLALIEALSFCGGVRHKRLSGEQETASKNLNTKKPDNCLPGLKCSPLSKNQITNYLKSIHCGNANQIKK